MYFMTNLNNIFNYYNVHSHNQPIVEELFTVHLPKQYTSIIQKRLKEEGIEVTSGAIRNVKCGLAKDLNVYGALIALAQEQKRIADALNESLVDQQTS